MTDDEVTKGIIKSIRAIWRNMIQSLKCLFGHHLWYHVATEYKQWKHGKTAHRHSSMCSHCLYDTGWISNKKFSRLKGKEYTVYPDGYFDGQ